MPIIKNLMGGKDKVTRLKDPGKISPIRGRIPNSRLGGCGVHQCRQKCLKGGFFSFFCFVLFKYFVQMHGPKLSAKDVLGGGLFVPSKETVLDSSLCTSY